MANEDWEQGRQPRWTEWKRDQEDEEGGSVISNVSAEGPRWTTWCRISWKKLALGSLAAALILTLVLLFLYFESARLKRNYRRKMSALEEVHSNYTQMEGSYRHNVSQMQCGRYEETFLRWLASFCQTINCTTHLCHRFWTPFGGNCYYFSRTVLGWDASRQACIAHGSELLVIRSEAEQFVGEHNITRSYWIGIKDSPLGSRWSWVDGSPLQEELTLPPPRDEGRHFAAHRRLGTVTPSEFGQALGLLRGLAKSLRPRPHGVRLGMLQVGERPRLELPLGLGTSAERVLGALDKLRQDGGQANTEQALAYVARPQAWGRTESDEWGRPEAISPEPGEGMREKTRRLGPKPGVGQNEVEMPRGTRLRAWGGGRPGGSKPEGRGRQRWSRPRFRLGLRAGAGAEG
ncbi:uncharacterized protein [Narcine bancroftii]|uniref:uncharacterized protein isoform X2 n=1 Tax=Narcine bancroftii TaxID=1343680 RepID=UPI003831914A